MRARRPDSPTPEGLIKVFGGRVYRPVGGQIRLPRAYAWSGDPASPLSVEFAFRLGQRDEVIVESARVPDGSRFDETGLLMNAVFEITRRRPQRFPLTLARVRQAIDVDGSPQVFRGFTLGTAAVVMASLGEPFEVMVRCPRRRLKTLKLEGMNAAKLHEVLPPPRN